MAATKFDARQVISRDQLQQLYPNVSGAELDDLLRSINSDLTSPFRLDASNPTDLIVNVGSSLVTNAISDRNHTISHLGGSFINFSSGTVEFPSTSGGTITVTPGNNSTLTVPSNEYIKVTIYLDSSGDLNVIAGASAALEANAIVAEAPAGLALGYVTLFNNAGTIDNISQANITQFLLGSSGGSSGSVFNPETDLSILTVLEAAELGANEEVDGNEILDTFNSAKGTKVDLNIASSQLRIDTSQTTGTYTRVKEVTATVATVEGVAVVRWQALAPIAEAIVDASGVIKFSGDVTSYFTSGDNLYIAKQITTDDKLAYIGLTDNNKVRKFEITNVTYSAPNTEITVDNTSPESDLDMGISAGNIPDQLRVFPMGHKIEVRTDSGGSLEELEIDDLIIKNPDTVTLSAPLIGYTIEEEVGNPTESTAQLAAAKSPNGQYVAYMVTRNSSGNDTWEWFYSVDGGITFDSLGTKSTGKDNSNNTESNHRRDSRMLIADNGKLFAAYNRNNDQGFNAVYGIRADLSNVNPPSTFADVADSGIGGGTPTAGRIHSHSGHNTMAYDASSDADLGLIAVGTGWLSNSTFSIQTYLSGGSSFGQTVSPGVDNIALFDDRPNPMVVVGTSPNRRIWLVKTSGTTISASYWDETATDVFGGSETNAGNITSGGTIANTDVVDMNFPIGANTGYVFWKTDSNNTRLSKITNTETGSPVITSLGTVINQNSGVILDSKNGDASAGHSTWWKTLHRRIVVDPNDANHIFLAADFTEPDSTTRPLLLEIADTADFLGIQVSQYTANAQAPIGDSAIHRSAQSFTTSSTRFRTVAIRCYNTDVIDTNMEYEMAIQGVSGSVPDDVDLAVSLNTLKPIELTKSTSGQWFYFNFDDVAVENLTGTHFIVVREKTALNPNNSTQTWQWMMSSSSVITGNKAVYAGSWTANASQDHTFEVYGDWVTDLGKDASYIDSSYDSEIHNYCETQVFLDKYENALATYRKSTGVDANIPQTGHIKGRLLTINSGAKATIGDEDVIGFVTEQGSSLDNFDENLTFNVALGSDACQELNTVTGADSAPTHRYEDRSGHNRIVVGSNSDSVISDSDFQEGTAHSFNGSSSYIAWDNEEGFKMQIGVGRNNRRDIVWEFEVKDGATAANGTFFSKWSGVATSNGYRCRTAAADASQIEMYITNSTNQNITAVRTATGFLTNAYTRVRVIYDAEDAEFRVYKSTGANLTAGTNGAPLYVEATYSVSPITVFSSGLGLDATDPFTIGRVRDGTGYLNAKIGYFKILKGKEIVSDETGLGGFAYHGFKSQPALTRHFNLGDAVGSIRIIGQNSDTIATPFYEGYNARRGGSISVVDTYDQTLKFERTLAAQGNELELKITMKRASEDDQSSIRGINFVFNK